jgi:hypothetical protein
VCRCCSRVPPAVPPALAEAVNCKLTTQLLLETALGLWLLPVLAWAATRPDHVGSKEAAHAPAEERSGSLRAEQRIRRRAGSPYEVRRQSRGSLSVFARHGRALEVALFVIVPATNMPVLHSEVCTTVLVRLVTATNSKCKPCSPLTFNCSGVAPLRSLTARGEHHAPLFSRLTSDTRGAASRFQNAPSL